MKKSELKKEKLGIKKFQISKIENPQKIIGGNAIDGGPIKTSPTLGDEDAI